MTEKHSPLLPCPFCGATDPVLLDTGVHWGRCASCMAEGAPFDTSEEAIAFWNTRAVNGLPEAIAALMDIRARARFELDNPTELRDTAFSLIEKAADAALAKLKAEP